MQTCRKEKGRVLCEDPQIISIINSEFMKGFQSIRSTCTFKRKKYKELEMRAEPFFVLFIFY